MSDEVPDRKRLSKAEPKQTTRARRLRKEMSPPEVIVWQHLRPKYNKDFTLRRQAAILPGIIVDFYCARKKIAFEIDGSIHDWKQQIDKARDGKLNLAGVTVVRISARRVFEDPHAVAEFIRLICLGEIDPKDIE